MTTEAKKPLSTSTFFVSWVIKSPILPFITDVPIQALLVGLDALVRFNSVRVGSS